MADAPCFKTRLVYTKYIRNDPVDGLSNFEPLELGLYSEFAHWRGKVQSQVKCEIKKKVKKEKTSPRFLL